MMKKNPSKELLKEYKKEIQSAKKVATEIVLNTDADEDYIETRDTLKRLIVKAEEALDPLLNLSLDAESPRAYEVLCNLLKTISELSESLMKLQKTRHAINKLDNPSDPNLLPPGTTNNTAIFVGSTDALQRYLKSQQGQVIDVEYD